jgi:hypothetical protein
MRHASAVEFPPALFQKHSKSKSPQENPPGSEK